MDWDDEDDSGYDDFDYGPKQEVPDSMDINNPSSAYFYFSDDAQDEIIGNDSKNMKCLSCGNRFRGDIYDRCPKCFSMDTQELENGQK